MHNRKIFSVIEILKLKEYAQFQVFKTMELLLTVHNKRSVIKSSKYVYLIFEFQWSRTPDNQFRITDRKYYDKILSLSIFYNSITYEISVKNR